MTKETKNKSKIILPLAITGVLLVGGVGSCSVMQLNKTKTEKDADTEVVNDDDNNDSDNDANNNNNNDNEDESENEVELQRDEEGNITFTKPEDSNDDYSHLKDTVKKKAEQDEEGIHFAFDDEGNLIASKKKDKDSDLLASIDKEQVVIPSDKDSDKTDTKDDISNEDTSNNDGNDSNSGTDSDNSNNEGNTGDNNGGSDEGNNDVEDNTGNDDGNTGGSDDNNHDEDDNNNGSDDDNNGEDDNNNGDSDDNDNETPDPKPIDKEDLNNAIASASSLFNNEHRYVTDSWNILIRAYDKAISARDNNVSQHTVNEATNGLWSAINNLEVKPPVLAIGGLDQLEGKDKNITTNRRFKVSIGAKDVDGNDLRKRVTLNGFPVWSFTNNYTLFLKEGINKIVVETSDSFGGTAKEEFEINYVKDVTPELTHSPISNDNVKDGIFTFETEAFDYKDDQLEVIVTHNGEEVIVKDGKVEVELTEGINEFKLTTTDERHNKTKEIEFRFEYTDDGFIEGDDVEYNDPTLDVNGLDEDNIEDGRISFTVDAVDGYGRNVTAEVIHNGEVVEGENDYTVDLIDGENIFEINMTDKLGNTISEKFIIVYDEDEHQNPQVEPELNINGIDSEYVSVTDKNFTFTATATDGNGDDALVQVFLNSSELTSDDNGVFSFELEEGDNKIVIIATDDYDNTIEEEYIINYTVNEEDQENSDDNTDEDGIDNGEDESDFDENENANDDSEEDQSDSDENTSEDDEVNPNEDDNGDEENSSDSEEVIEEDDTNSEQEQSDSDEVTDEEQNDVAVGEDEPMDEEVFEEILVNGNVGNSNKEFNSLQEAKIWAEQTVSNESSDWKDYEFEFIQIDYYTIDSNGEKVEGTERSTWSVQFTQKKEVAEDEVVDVEENEDTLIDEDDKESDVQEVTEEAEEIEE